MKISPRKYKRGEIVEDVNSLMKSLLDKVDDYENLLNELLCEATQDHPAEARLSLSILKEKLEDYSTGKYPYSVQTKLKRRLREAEEIIEKISKEPERGENVHFIIQEYLNLTRQYMEKYK